MSQVEGLGLTISELYKKHPNIGIIFDGMKTERETMEKIKSLMPKSITTYNGLDCSVEETVVWSHAVDFAVAPAGAGIIFTVIANKPAVMHGPKGFCTTVPSCATPRENCVLSHYIDPQDVTDETDAYVSLCNSVVGRNYDFDWKKLYSKIIAPF
ncbi:MAG: hypothetical protein MGG11_15020 [Trichodesmium sp. MAG_R03]|nr:hypothetical protein [Trichodesmium sp. MAG_R03]